MNAAARVTRVVLITVVAISLAGCATRGLRPSDQQRIVGKTYVITGASSGFGRGVALELAAHRANVVLAARRTDLLEEVAAQAREAGGSVLVVTTDVGNAADIQRLAEATVARFGKIDVWINNAGVGLLGRFEEVPLEDYSRLVDVNLKGVIYGSHVALRQFRQQGHGVLVNVGSIESEVPLAYQGVYSATKAGVLSLGRVLNEEIRLGGNRNIRVATVMPWAADTPLFTHVANYTGRAPRMIAMDDPQKVVNAIVRISLYPREELSVGWKAKGAYASYQVLPDLTERISANIAHREQMEKAPPAPPTSGTLHRPMREGRDVDGGTMERMAQEDRQRESQRR